MIQVVTLSPAIDVTYTLDKMQIGEVNRVTNVARIPGGKGLNVARVLKKLGKSPTLHCPLGGANGDWLEDQLGRLDINTAITKISANTRSAITVSDTDVTVLNEPATELTDDELEVLKFGVGESEVVIFSGSVPANISIEQFESLLKTLKSKTKTLIVDTSGEYLVAASKYADYLKPNLEELENATGWPKQQALESITAMGSKVILSLGEKGVELHGEARIVCRVPVQSGNPTGAGDALTAGFAAYLDQGEEKALVQGCALSAASVKSNIAGDFDHITYEQLLKQVEVSG